jgi:hypothetical protein
VNSQLHRDRSRSRNSRRCCGPTIQRRNGCAFGLGTTQSMVWRHSMSTAGQTGDPPLNGSWSRSRRRRTRSYALRQTRTLTPLAPPATRSIQARAAAMVAGRSLTEIALAEAHGNQRLRSSLRSDALKPVERAWQSRTRYPSRTSSSRRAGNTPLRTDARDRTSGRRHGRHHLGTRQPLGQPVVRNRSAIP